jgi:exosome complex component RRP40
MNNKKKDKSFNDIVVMPGDDVTANVTVTTKSISIGSGLEHRNGKVYSTSVGILSFRQPCNYSVESNRKRYYPKVGDQVVGIIEDKGGDFYVVNIFSGANCILNRLSFEGATKRNKPELKKGDLIYARVSVAGKDIDTELSCLATSGAKKEWSTGETVKIVFF